LHVALLGWALLAIGATKPLKLPEEIPVEVAIVSPDALTRLKPGDRTAKELETEPKEAPAKEPPRKETPNPRVEPAAAPPPPPPPPKDEIAKRLADPPPKEAQPTPEDQLALERKIAEEHKKAEEQKKAEEARRKAAEAKRKAEEAARKAAEAKRKQFDAERVAALLNKLPDDKQAPAGSPSPAPATRKGPSAGAAEGRDTQLSANEKSMLLSMIVNKVKTCWNINAGIEGAAQLVPIITFELNRDGSVRGTPKVMNASSSPQFQDAANSAIRAVMQCQNYNLPPERYEVWESVTLRFDPSQMFR
jgi:colicin import membrane protein